MPMKNMGKPTLGKVKTGFKLMSIPRSAPQKASRVGEIASNNKLVSSRGGKGHNSGAGGMKRGKRMY